MTVLLDKVILMLKALQHTLEQKIKVVSEQFTNPDYNQNDPSKPDYIKNRPFYSVIEGEDNYLVEPMEIQIVYGEVYTDTPVVIDPSEFVKGSTVLVIWNDIVYECAVKEHRYVLCNCVGNADDGSEEPFCILDIDGTGELTIRDPSWSYTGTVTFAMAKSLAKKTIVRMEEKYLPESIEARFESVNAQVDEANARVNEIDSRIDETSADIETVKQNTPHSEIVPDRIYQDVGSGFRGLVSNITPDISIIVGARVFLNSQEWGLIEYYVTADDITQYEWGYDFKYGFVMTADSATIGDKSYSEPGLYLGVGYDWLDDRFTGWYASYGLEFTSRLDEKYLPTSVPRVQTAEVGQVLVVEAVDDEGKPTEWRSVAPSELIKTESTYRHCYGITEGKDDLYTLTITTDIDGEDFDCRDYRNIDVVAHAADNKRISNVDTFYLNNLSVSFHNKSNGNTHYQCSFELPVSIDKTSHDYQSISIIHHMHIVRTDMLIIPSLSIKVAGYTASGATEFIRSDTVTSGILSINNIGEPIDSISISYNTNGVDYSEPYVSVLMY